MNIFENKSNLMFHVRCISNRERFLIQAYESVTCLKISPTNKVLSFSRYQRIRKKENSIIDGDGEG